MKERREKIEKGWKGRKKIEKGWKGRKREGRDGKKVENREG